MNGGASHRNRWCEHLFTTLLPCRCSRSENRKSISYPTTITEGSRSLQSTPGRRSLTDHTSISAAAIGFAGSVVAPRGGGGPHQMASIPRRSRNCRLGTRMNEGKGRRHIGYGVWDQHQNTNVFCGVLIARPFRPFHESVSSGDTLMPMITIHHADGRFKVLKNGEQIRVPMSTGQSLPVEFQTREAAEGYATVYSIITRKRTRSPK